VVNCLLRPLWFDLRTFGVEYLSGGASSRLFQTTGFALNQSISETALNRARRKAYWRLLPLLFACYVIAYVDRANVSIAKLKMSADLGFDNAVIGFAAGIFFIGYFLLEIPGTIIVERWSASKWISRIM